MENKAHFQYTYSAREQAEIAAIRKKYVAPEQTEDKMEQLRRLDTAVTQKATTVSLVFGIIGTLIMGSGMSLAMTNLGTLLGLRQEMVMLLGVAIGVVGILLVALAYPIYNRVLRKERKRIAPEILRLTDALMK